MKKFTFLSIFLIAFSFLSFAQVSDLIISEYGEGSSGSSKYIEIYNGTGTVVDLSNYQLWRVSNGGTWPEATYDFTTSSLADGATLVIANNTTDVPGADEYNTFCSWNGDDAAGLAKDDGSGTFVLLDAIGTDGADPGTGWSVAGTTDATVNNSLIRKATVCSPTTNWAASSGTDETNSEWIVTAYVTGTPTTMGNHTANCSTSSPELTWASGTFTEATANDGSIGNTIALTLTDETFATVGALVSGTDFSVANVPAGLTVSITSGSTTAAVVSLTGNATSHANADDIANMEITFANAAFTGADASAVTNSSKTDLVVDFDDPAATPELTWDAGTFTEATANDGSIGNTIALTLTDETFATVGALVSGTDFSVANVPTGLTVSVTSGSTTAAVVSLTGNATSHANADDIANMEITFTNAAFTGADASAVTNSSKTDLVVDFDDATATSVSMLENNSRISVFPNPTTGIFTVNGENITKVEVLDISGKIVLRSENNTNIFNIEKEKSGVYFVKVYNNDSVKVLKIILK